MDTSDDRADDENLPERLPPKDDRLWAHPSEYHGPTASQSHRIAALLAAIALVLIGLTIAKTTWPTTRVDNVYKPASTFTLSTATSNHIGSLAKALVSIVTPGKQSTTVYGLAISPDGYILAPASVLGPSKSFTVSTAGISAVSAKLVAEDSSTDTAVLKISKPLTDYVSGTSQPGAKAGEMTVGIVPNAATGKPDLVISQIEQAGLQQILSTGQVSNDTYLADPAKKFNPEGILFVDSKGNPLGLGLGTISNKWVIAPLSNMLASAQKIELSDGVPHGWLGIVGTSLPPKSINGKLSTNLGVSVYSVVPNSPAQKAGIQLQDEIVALDDTPVTSLQQLQSMLAQFPSGSQVTLTLVRGNERLSTQIQLGVKSAH